jgi:tetratricopeptide (TPR) repeat protein
MLSGSGRAFDEPTFAEIRANDMSKKARARKKHANRSHVGSAMQTTRPLGATPEPEVSTIRLHDAALDEESPTILSRNEARNEAPKDDDEALSVSFFEGSNSPSLSPVELDLDDQADEIRRITLTPAGVARRAKLGRYVAAAVGLAALVGVAGAVRGRSTHDAALAAASPARVQVAAVQPVTTPAPVVAPAVPVAAVPVSTVPVAVPVAVTEIVKQPEELKPAEEVKKVEEPKKLELDPVQAKKEKNASRNALEAGKNVKAIEAGERSVALDPTDAEAWLILGAAYQTKGNNAEAKRCFKSCLTEGKRGPKGECAAMAR